MDTLTVEYRIGALWHVAATFTATDLAKIALAAFKRAQSTVEWRMTK